METALHAAPQALCASIEAYVYIVEVSTLRLDKVEEFHPAIEISRVAYNSTTVWVFLYTNLVESEAA